MDSTTLGVTLDTTMVPDVFGLHAFDSRAPVVRVLLGAFSNTVRVLVPDASAAPVGRPSGKPRLDIAGGPLCLRICIGIRLIWRL